MPRCRQSLIRVRVAIRFNVNRQPNSEFKQQCGRMDYHTIPGPDSKSLNLLGIAGTLVGAKIVDALEFHFLGVGTVIGQFSELRFL
jgi:hypothetical protein